MHRAFTVILGIGAYQLAYNVLIKTVLSKLMLYDYSGGVYASCWIVTVEINRN